MRDGVAEYGDAGAVGAVGAVGAAAVFFAEIGGGRQARDQNQAVLEHGELRKLAIPDPARARCAAPDTTRPSRTRALHPADESNWGCTANITHADRAVNHRTT